MEKVLYFAVLAGVIVILAILAQKRFSQNGRSSPSSTGRGANSPAPPAAQAAPQPPPAATIQQSPANNPKPRPILKWILIGIAVTIGIDLVFLGGRALLTYNEGIFGSSVISRTPVNNLSHGAPIEIARQVICQCESRCKQFGSDGKPLKNQERASSAFGKYQFIEAHREEARKLGFDLNTEAGQDGYFTYRYQRYGTKDWESDPRSVACWEPKFAAKGYSTVNILLEGTRVLEIPPGDFSGEIEIPSGIFFSWGDSSSEFLVKDQKGAIARYEPNKGVMENLPYPSTRLSFQPLGDKTAIVKLKLSRTPLVKM